MQALNAAKEANQQVYDVETHMNQQAAPKSDPGSEEEKWHTESQLDPRPKKRQKSRLGQTPKVRNLPAQCTVKI